LSTDRMPFFGPVFIKILSYYEIVFHNTEASTSTC
jgi:hypothetical protein